LEACSRQTQRRGDVPQFSTKHLPNYLNAFEFRWNTRKLDDGQRVARAIPQMDSKRLEYREPVDNPPYLVTATGQLPAFEGYAAAPWHFLYFFPLPHGHGSLRPTPAKAAR